MSFIISDQLAQGLELLIKKQTLDSPLVINVWDMWRHPDHASKVEAPKEPTPPVGDTKMETPIDAK